MLVYIEFNNGTYGYYECDGIFIDDENIENSKIYLSNGGAFSFNKIKSATLCKDGGEFSKAIFERGN